MAISSLDNILSGVVGGIIVGIITWLALKRILPDLGWKELIFILAGWATAYAWLIFGVNLFSTLGPAPGAIGIALGGLITALAIRKSAGFNWIYIFLISVSWGCAAYLFGSWNPLNAAIGGGVMLWLITSIKLRNKTIPERQS